MKLTREDLWSLEEYAQKRETFRQDVIAHKKSRNVALGPNATLYFEDELTMRYQIQEMLRVERIFETAEIEEELASYNPLIPDGNNWKATFMIEYGDAEERKVALASMGGIELTVWVQVDGSEKIYAIANEDMDRTRDEKAAAVHFTRFELSAENVADLKSGKPLTMGIDHQSIPCAVTIEGVTRETLLADLT
jgi:hypothetical protein